MSYDFDFDEPRSGVREKIAAIRFSLGPRFAVGLVLVALLVMASMFWGAYPENDADLSSAVPIIRADAQPVKIAPDDPGGMKVAHQDSALFNALRGQEDEAPVENLLSDEDEDTPIPRSQLFAGLNTEETMPDAADQAQMDEMVAQVADADTTTPAIEVPEAPEAPDMKVSKLSIKTQEAALQDIAPAAGEDLSTASNESVSMNEAAKLVSQLDPAAGAASVVPQVGDYYIQVGSVRSADGAEGEWKKIQQKYRSALNGYSHRVERADLGAKGVFYRIQAGPVSRDAANTACNNIKQKTPGGCWIVKK